MWKNRVGYGLTLLLMFALWFLFSNWFLLYVAIGMLLVVILMGVFVRLDAKKVEIRVSTAQASQEGKTGKLYLKVHTKGNVWAAQSMIVDMKVRNKMYGTEREKVYQLLLNGKNSEFEIPQNMNQCGKLIYECQGIWLQDIFHLFQVKVKPFAKKSTTVYPKRMHIVAEISQKTVGTPKNEGIMQNRKGHDPSEMYNIREYVPGDDVRSIHWKLSSKTDSLILREPSDPSHYRVAILADYGCPDADKKMEPEKLKRKIKEWNTVMGTGAEVARKLLQKGETFCVMFPTERGLYTCEVKNNKDFQRMMTQWMGTPMRQKAGTGLQYFLTQQEDREFSRLIILGDEAYEQNLNGAEERIGITILRAVSGRKEMRSVSVAENCEVIEVPTDGKETAVYRMIC